MPAKRELTMRQLRYMLRLHHDGMSARAIGRTLGVARTIQDNLRRAQASGIAWPLSPELTDDFSNNDCLHARDAIPFGQPPSPRRQPPSRLSPPPGSACASAPEPALGLAAATCGGRTGEGRSMSAYRYQ
jgi:hypothetical protein